MTNLHDAVRPAYRVLTDEEKAALGYGEYDFLVGPDGFECFLGEPEDRSWYRDANAAVVRLNKQHEELTTLRAALASTGKGALIELEAAVELFMAQARAEDAAANDWSQRRYPSARAAAQCRERASEYRRYANAILALPAISPAAPRRPMMPAGKHCLIDKTLLGVKIASDKGALLFQTAEGDIIARADGDCCSHTWFENVDLPALGFPAVVVVVEDVPLPGSDDNHPEHECLQVYGCKITTDRGDILIDYRNSSNGYYGGNLSWPDERTFYGGVHGQNVSTMDWQDIRSES